MKFKDYINQTAIIEDKIATLIYLSEADFLNESDINEGIKDWLEKAGLKIHKGDGIIDYVKQFTSGTGKLILAAIKGDKEEVKRIAGTLEKAKVIDFLLKLDMATMHIVTGPIHMIDAITGWDLAVNLKSHAHTASNVLKTIWDSIKNIKTNIVNIIDAPNRNIVIKHIDDIESSLPKDIA